MKPYQIRINHAALLFVSIILCSGCTTNAPRTTLNQNEARVVGHRATILNSVNVFVALADQPPPRSFKRELIIPAGHAHLALRYGAVSLSVETAVANEVIADKKIEEVEFDAEAGHEYYAEMTGISIFDMGFRVTDKATGEVAADTNAR